MYTDSDNDNGDRMFNQTKLSILLINRTQNVDYISTFDVKDDQTFTNFTNSTTTTTTIVPSNTLRFNSDNHNTINGSIDRGGWWTSTIYTNPDVMLAFAMIVFYAIFVLFICVIIIRIVLTIMLTGSSFKFSSPSDALSDTIEGETSSRTQGYSQSVSRGYRPRYHQEMTSFAIDRTNSPSIIDEDDEEDS